MNRAAEKVYNVLRQEGTQKSVIDIMQTRNELYESINYQVQREPDAVYARNRLEADTCTAAIRNNEIYRYYKNVDEDGTMERQ